MKKAITTMNQGVSEVEKGSSLIDTAGAVFEKISAAVEVISDQVREVSAATEQMSASSRKSAQPCRKWCKSRKIPSAVLQFISAASEEQSCFHGRDLRIKPCLSEMAQELQETLTKFKA
ncbi:hypothetical protein P7H17_13885 [Paenibacillus larvae]|nr:hypothetical protein [Paenibacillus larvae]MDT2286898.1 hypothetical protein [Paenibacillus larvae]